MTAVRSRTRKITILAALSAIAFVVMLVGRIPIVSAAPFLKYDPKDVVIAIAGFIYGPLSALAVAVVVSLVEMFTVSESGIIGFVMNVLSSAAFACIASLIYARRKKLSGAILGLLCGVVTATAVMMLWNYFVAPIYMGMPREAVAKLLLPAFLPFNLLKHSLNGVLTFLLYKPLVKALRSARLIDDRPGNDGAVSRAGNIGIAIAGLLVLALCVVLALVLGGYIRIVPGNV